ncbi:hypothetical protein DIPPA_32230 [Diplonema papillatum]|nr:hypothetical protein DIPPA_32230 [Diplonema papillatum]
MPIVRESMAVKHVHPGGRMTTTDFAEQTDGYILYPNMGCYGQLGAGLAVGPGGPTYSGSAAFAAQMNAQSAMHSRPPPAAARPAYTSQSAGYSGLANAGTQSMTIATSNLALDGPAAHQVVQTALASQAGGRGATPSYHATNAAVRASLAQGGLTSAAADASHAGASSPMQLGGGHRQPGYGY